MNLIDKEPVVIEGGTITDILNFTKEKVKEISPELFEKIKQLPQEALSSLKRILPGNSLSSCEDIQPVIDYLTRDNGFITKKHQAAINHALENYDPIRD